VWSGGQEGKTQNGQEVEAMRLCHQLEGMGEGSDGGE
jgi:hypothetical protein